MFFLDILFLALLKAARWVLERSKALVLGTSLFGRRGFESHRCHYVLRFVPFIDIFFLRMHTTFLDIPLFTFIQLRIYLEKFFFNSRTVEQCLKTLEALKSLNQSDRAMKSL